MKVALFPCLNVGAVFTTYKLFHTSSPVYKHVCIIIKHVCINVKSIKSIRIRDFHRRMDAESR